MTPDELLLAVAEGRATLALTAPPSKGRAVGEIRTPSGERFEVRLHLQQLRGGEHASVKRWRSQPRWREDELVAEGLPLYWSRSWLVYHLTNHKSLADIEAVTGQKASILKRWKARHRIEGNPFHDAVRKAWASGDYATRQALADHFGLHVTSLDGIIGKNGPGAPSLIESAVDLLLDQGLRKRADVLAHFPDEDPQRVYRVLRERVARRKFPSKGGG